MKDEVPSALIDAHVKQVEVAIKEGEEVDPHMGLDKSGIAGTSGKELSAQLSAAQKSRHTLKQSLLSTYCVFTLY